MSQSNKPKYIPDPEGQESISKAILKTANSYPGLDKNLGERFRFCETEPEEGLSLMVSSGSFIYDHHESITGHVWEQCLYPFVVIYRASGLNENRKMEVKEWIDSFAKWLTRQPVTLKGERYQLAEWPKLTDGRVIREVTRTSTTYLSTIDDGKTEVWISNLQIQYRNEFDR